MLNALYLIPCCINRWVHVQPQVKMSFWEFDLNKLRYILRQRRSCHPPPGRWHPILRICGRRRDAHAVPQDGGSEVPPAGPLVEGWPAAGPTCGGMQPCRQHPLARACFQFLSRPCLSRQRTKVCAWLPFSVYLFFTFSSIKLYFFVCSSCENSWAVSVMLMETSFGIKYDPIQLFLNVYIWHIVVQTNV
jgi:hypothetical protein